jgi:hypothetical protein
MRCRFVFAAAAWLSVFLSALLSFPATLRAQRDFLTPDEVDKVREAQIPADRLKLYVLFARQRMDEFEKIMAHEKKGRSVFARELLEDYTQIIEAIDTVSDDALKRKIDISLGTEAVQTAERNFAANLQKIYAASPPDLDLYEVDFKEAMATTLDSLDQAVDDTAQRAQDLSEKEQKDKEQAKAILAAEDSKGKPPADSDGKTADANADPAKPKRKPPTLLKPGEAEGQPIH